MTRSSSKRGPRKATSKDSRLVLGRHLSIAGGYHQAARSAVSIGANTFQFFTRNPRGGAAKSLDREDIAKLAEIVRDHEFGPLFAHAPYTLNACSAKESVREFARTVLRDDLERLSELPLCYYIIHPGSGGETPRDEAIELIAAALDEALAARDDVMLLLEGMSGKGSEVGGSIEELRQIIDAVEHGGALGVCLDTCHMFAAGYDIVGDLEGVLGRIDAVLGLDRVKAVHLNDSMHVLGSRKDRHAPLGEGEIGLEAMVRFVSHPALRHLPFNLETPGDLDSWPKEIAVLREGYRRVVGGSGSGKDDAAAHRSLRAPRA